MEMPDTAITTLTGKKDAVGTWKTLVEPNDIVGIKTNAWSHIPTTGQTYSPGRHAPSPGYGRSQ
ncbi:MAG: hypothetical protein NT166_23680 [Candidatus Aminicenantes bacterium]|nr:hypothetical protein [Candidatus Aminicenantes bacterium]